MFVHFSTNIQRPYDEVEKGFVSAPTAWLPAMVESAYESGDGIRAKVGIGKANKLTKEVIVRVGDTMTDRRRTVLPIRVEAAGATALFPQLDADLEITPFDSDTTQLVLKGSYRPPLGAAGAVLDRALLHRVAESVVENFLERVAVRIGDRTSHQLRP